MTSPPDPTTTDWVPLWPLDTNDPGAIPKSLVDAKGDLIVASANDVVGRLPAGADGLTLLADAAQPLGLKWAPVSGGYTTYRKVTQKTNFGSVADVDLLNGEITLPAGVMGTNKVCRLYAEGDMINSTGGSQVLPRWKVKLGGVTVVDTGALPVASMATAAARYGWRLTCEIFNLGAANAQYLTLRIESLHAGAAAAVAFVVGNGYYMDVVLSGGVAWMLALGGAAGAVDTSVAKLLELTAANPSAANYEVVLKAALVEIA